MKTKLFLSLILSLSISIGLTAKNPETTTFSNVQTTATGSIKEFTTFDAKSNQPTQRSTYKYDLDENIQEKIVYTWSQDKGWIGHQKLEYTYDDSTTDKPSSLTFTKWNNKTSNWDDNSRTVTYEYDAEGNASVGMTK